MDEQAMQEMYRLTRENNRMLHRMRRSAFWGGILKFVFYFLILVVAPLYVYTTYFAPLVEQMQKTINQVQGTNAKAQAQFGSFEDMLKQFGSKFGSGSSSTSQ